MIKFFFLFFFVATGLVWRGSLVREMRKSVSESESEPEGCHVVRSRLSVCQHSLKLQLPQ